ncbi:hypothetical protein K435DRAFT_669341 [Dendrothele bispora CBS 962.96]|uniref:SH3 domain-containing protein n=1 Tax=Dendrothele bispora (strain CBS 962.96) TaxID=1314807 RepID=A0A4S8LW74_DENBC|nr:hypothetical protein K435DRAFT_669341 [Dendrothele bispora CBS 962.96]
MPSSPKSERAAVAFRESPSARGVRRHPKLQDQNLSPLALLFSNRTNDSPTDDIPSGAQERLDHFEDPSASLTDVSYAVAIYPYSAEEEDEFNVGVGDTFIILSRAPGWWVVLCDLTGSGKANPALAQPGWVPVACFLETCMPIADAVAEAAVSDKLDSPVNITLVLSLPIKTTSIISASYAVVALVDYKAEEEEEVDLVRGDELRAFKRYNHWIYVVKEEDGHRGWVPSWLIGKVASRNS